jgi:hypothetical protein
MAGTQALLSTIGRRSSEDREGYGNVHATDHVWVRYVRVPEAYARAVARIYESCQAILKEKWGVEQGFCVMPGKRLHVHICAERGGSLSLFTSPGSTRYPLVVNNMSDWESGLAPPDQGGPHVVYGYCHELGHVLMGWEDSRHQWAHFVGSRLLEDVVDRLGEKTWPKPYDYRSEGMARYMAKIEGASPGRDSDEGTARIFYEVGEAFGLEIWGKVLTWIREHREGKPFHALRLYKLDDIRDALLDLECDESRVMKILGG